MPDEVIGKPVTMLIPLERHNEEPSILARIRRGERIDHYETVRRRKDGSLVEISLSVSPVRNPAGEIVGASKIARDITERRQAQQHQQMLLREMDHRVKNLFSLASSLVNLSARSAKTPEQLASTVGKRLRSFGAVARPDASQGIGKRSVRHVRSTTLHALIETIMSPYSDPAARTERVLRVSGPDIPLSEDSVTSFALLLHEFATNAAKYGALSAAGGSHRDRLSPWKAECLRVDLDGTRRSPHRTSKRCRGLRHLARPHDRHRPARRRDLPRLAARGPGHSPVVSPRTRGRPAWLTRELLRDRPGES